MTLRLPRLALAALLLFVLVGCSIEVGNITKCLDWDELEASDRQTIESVSLGVFNSLKSGDTDAIWNTSHPDLREELGYEQWTEVAEYMHARADDVSGVEIARGHLITASDTSAPFTAVCGGVSQTDPTHVRIQVLSDAPRVAVAVLDMPGDTVGRRLTLQFAEHEGSLKVRGAYMTARTSHGRDAAYFLSTAQEWRENDELVGAHLAYAMAQILSWSGTFFRTSEVINIEEQVAAFQEDQRAESALTGWQVDGAEYQIISVRLVEAVSEIGPQVRYLTSRELSEQPILEEAGLLLRYLERNNPTLGSEFDRMLFAGYKELPVDPEKRYHFYQVLVPLAERDGG